MKDKPENPQWIDVKDRLPEFTCYDKTASKKVIVFCDGYVTIGYLYKEYDNKDNIWFTVDNTFDEELIKPTYWMPLPKPAPSMLAERSKSDE